MDSKLFTLHTIETLWNKIKNKFYVKSADGIPKSDLDITVQSSLSKADSALQEHQDISGKQDKSTAVTHTASVAVGSTTKPAYIAANGVATPISHSINSDVPANAKFTDTTYSDATESTHGLMSAADKKKLDGMDSTKYLPKSGGVMTGDIDMQTNKKDILVGTQKANVSDGTIVAGGIIEKRANITSTLPEMRSFIGSFHNTEIDRFYSLISVRHRNGCNDGNIYGMYIFSDLTSANGNLKWGKQTAEGTWTDDLVLLDSRNYTSYAAKNDHTHAMIINSSKLIGGANNAAQWCKLGTLVSAGNFTTAVIRVWSGNGANGTASQNSSFEIHIKDGWQSTQSATKACGVTVYRTNAYTVAVRVIPIAHNTYTIWVYLPWGYWNGNYAVNGCYQTWTSDFKNQTAEPEGTAANTAYYDQAFLTSTVAKSTEAATLTDSGWVNMTLESYSKSGTVKYRIYGKQITITGKVVLKNNVATSSHAPQAIASSTTLNFSKIVGCSGVGRSSSGAGVYVDAENFNGDNIVCVYALGGEIAAGATLYFTITGFID